jgi:L-2-hydroxyglutarate oxidase LhgO
MLNKLLGKYQYMERGDSFDILIIGAGIVGLTIAYKLKLKNVKTKIAIIDKENKVGSHASGRCSGVLHAGFYYTPDSLKAKFAREGNAAMKKYCEVNNIPLYKNGKLVVARNESELPYLHDLYQRGKKNGVEISLINVKEVKSIEPKAYTFDQALYSPTTATVDPNMICNQLVEDLQMQGVEFFWNTPYIKRLSSNSIKAGILELYAGKFINASGLYADQIAHDFKAGFKYTIFPFKGIFLESTDPTVRLRTNIYPIALPKIPFMDVHFVVTSSGKLKIGPTAMPAFWRENYDGFSGFNLREFYQITSNQLKLFKDNNFNFRSLAYKELRKLSPRYLRKLALSLVQDMDLSSFKKWGKPGIRAQLVDVETLNLVNDFIVEEGENSLHILNAVSPGFTSSFSFAEWIVERYLQSFFKLPFYEKKLTCLS